MLLGAPTLKLRGDYLAIVTLGFGEIIRVFLNNLDHPVNITNGPKGLGQIDSIRLFKFDALGIPGINLGRSLGLEVIAEGIETPAQESLLRAMGCETGQGFLYSRAMPAADVPAAVSQPCDSQDRRLRA